MILKTSKIYDDSTESCSTAGVPKIFPKLQHRGAKCKTAEGEYFEGDPSQ
jgi:hypothetical protein